MRLKNAVLFLTLSMIMNFFPVETGAFSQNGFDTDFSQSASDGNVSSSASGSMGLTDPQRLILGKVVEALQKGIENRDLAQFLRGNFKENSLTREAADNLMFGRQNRPLAEKIENWMNTENQDARF